MTVHTFGEDLNPANIAIELKPGDSFRCPCGKHTFELGKYESAHWNTPLESKCSSCGQVFHLLAGEVKMAHPEQWYKDIQVTQPSGRFPGQSKPPAPQVLGPGSKLRRMMRAPEQS